MSDGAYPPILNKRQNYRLWQAGAFGNKLRAWRSVAEWRSSGFTGLVVLRSLAEGGGPCEYNVNPEDVDGHVDRWLVDKLATSDKIMINEAAPDFDVVLQGEYLNDILLPGWSSHWGYFHHSRAKRQMRDALREAPELSMGLRSDLLIKEAMSPASYEDWSYLIYRYPEHVFEVSIYERYLGDLPMRNALVWEIRRY